MLFNSLLDLNPHHFMVGVFYCPTDFAARDPDEVVRQGLLRSSDAVANP